MSATCRFCKGRPIQNAATWQDGKPRPPAECPRCGDTNVPDEEMEQIRRDIATLSELAFKPADEGGSCGVPYQAWLPDDRSAA